MWKEFPQVETFEDAQIEETIVDLRERLETLLAATPPESTSYNSIPEHRFVIITAVNNKKPKKSKTTKVNKQTNARNNPKRNP